MLEATLAWRLPNADQPCEIVTVQRYGNYIGAGGFFTAGKFTSRVGDQSAADRLSSLFSILAPTRLQLAHALGVSRQRIYQLLGGESPGDDTAARIGLIEQYATKWSALHSRPMGMILPKPASELISFWNALANESDQEAAHALAVLHEKHQAFERKQGRRLGSNGTFSGQSGMLPPPGYWSAE